MMKTRWMLFAGPRHLFADTYLSSLFAQTRYHKTFFSATGSVGAKGVRRRSSPPNGRHLCRLGLQFLGYRIKGKEFSRVLMVPWQKKFL